MVCCLGFRVWGFGACVFGVFYFGLRSLVTRRTSHVTRHTSLVARHTSHVIRNPSHRSHIHIYIYICMFKYIYIYICIYGVLFV